MKKVATKKVRKATIDDLAALMVKGFSDVNKKIDKEVNDLATIVAKGFERVDKRFDAVEKKLGGVEKEISEVKENLNTTRMDVLGIGDRFVSKHEFSQHLIRFDLLERKVKTKK